MSITTDESSSYHSTSSPQSYFTSTIYSTSLIPKQEQKIPRRICSSSLYPYCIYHHHIHLLLSHFLSFFLFCFDLLDVPCFFVTTKGLTSASVLIASESPAPDKNLPNDCVLIGLLSSIRSCCRACLASITLCTSFLLPPISPSSSKSSPTSRSASFAASMNH
mmetsp:Transcript_14223/g.16119  ORF Transcript_14223/g.16119 Transcript_14223/m.16119 type:complete len:163 (+) Transcript_14223:358-846(+)